jgi:hypothetical protein
MGKVTCPSTAKTEATTYQYHQVDQGKANNETESQMRLTQISHSGSDHLHTRVIIIISYSVFAMQQSRFPNFPADSKKPVHILGIPKIRLGNYPVHLISMQPVCRCCVYISAYKRRAPATIPRAPAAEPASMAPPVARGAAPGEVEDEAAAPLPPLLLVAWATWMPKLVTVVVTTVPLAVIVEVARLVAVVVAVQPAQVVHGASVDHGPLVQPARECQQ